MNWSVDCNAISKYAVYDTVQDLTVDASLLLYQKSIESLYENGLGIIEHHKVASKVKTTTGDYIAGNRKGLPLLGNFLHGTSEIIKSWLHRIDGCDQVNNTRTRWRNTTAVKVIFLCIKHCHKKNTVFLHHQIMFFSSPNYVFCIKLTM